MKPTFRSLLFFLAAASIVGCQSRVDIEPTSVTVSETRADADQSTSMDPPVLFQYAELNHQEGLLSGFLINAEGKVLEFSTTDIPNEYQYLELRRMPDYILNDLLETAVATGREVSQSELNLHHRSISRLRDHGLEVSATNHAANVTRAFFAFTTLIEEGESAYPASDCGDRRTHERAESSVDYLFVPIQAEGVKTLQHTGPATDEIVQWLIGVSEGTL